MIQILRSLLGGFLMGTADLVPGVSGGTIALVLGIYERLVGSIREGSSALGSLLKADLRGFKRHLSQVEWMFLLPLLAGIFAAIFALAAFIGHQLEERPTVVAGVFFGLVVGSVVIAWRLLRHPASVHMVTAAVVGVSLFFLLGFGDDRTVTDPSLITFFGAGALAICAMILPGISGSLILLLVGMYGAALGAVNDRDLVAVGMLLAGAVVGLGLLSQALHWALRRHHDTVLAGLIGLMAGSLRILWPWPDGVESSVIGAPGSDGGAVLLAAVLGLFAVYGISRLAGRDEETAIERQPSR